MFKTVDFKGIEVSKISIRVIHKEEYKIQNVEDAIYILQGLRSGDFLTIKWIGKLKFDFAIDYARFNANGDWFTEIVLWCDRVGASNEHVII
jgi:hypothetical protein